MITYALSLYPHLILLTPRNTAPNQIEFDEKISPNDNYHGATLETYDDHRMAMSLALAGLIIPEVIILDPNCCSKTFPTFFKIFLKLGEQNV